MNDEINPPQEFIQCECMKCGIEKICGYSYGSRGNLIRECKSCKGYKFIDITNGV